MLVYFTRQKKKKRSYKLSRCGGVGFVSQLVKGTRIALAQQRTTCIVCKTSTYFVSNHTCNFIIQSEFRDSLCTYHLIDVSSNHTNSVQTGKKRRCRDSPIAVSRITGPYKIGVIARKHESVLQTVASKLNLFFI